MRYIIHGLLQNIAQDGPILACANSENGTRFFHSTMYHEVDHHLFFHQVSRYRPIARIGISFTTRNSIKSSTGILILFDLNLGILLLEIKHIAKSLLQRNSHTSQVVLGSNIRCILGSNDYMWNIKVRRGEIEGVFPTRLGCNIQQGIKALVFYIFIDLLPWTRHNL